MSDPVLDYWRSGKGLEHITPPGTTWPEGEGFPLFLANLLVGEEVMEVGCGVGRLASALPPDSYVGVDVSRGAVELARERCPAHDFRLMAPEDDLPAGSAALLHTVLLHVTDEALPSLVARLSGFGRIVVGEIMGRHWRRPGNPPVFNRELADYEEAFEVAGFRLLTTYAISYPRYKDTFLTVADFRKGDGPA